MNGLRLFSPQDDAPRRPTLRDAWERWKKPELVQSRRSGGKRADYQRAVQRFESWWRQHRTLQAPEAGILKERMNDPLLTEIDRQTLTAFRTWFTADGGGSSRMANKTIQSLEAILLAAADHEEESGYDRRQNRLKPLETQHAAKKFYLSYEQVEALYRHAGAAQWPASFPAPVGERIRRPLPFSPAAYFRAAIVMWFTYGMRTQELISYSRTMNALTWEQICEDPDTPAEEGQATNEHGWFYYLPEKQKRLKPDPLVLPLSAVAMAHLQSIRPPDPLPVTRVFPFPYASDGFYAAWRRITSAAGVAPKRNLRTGEQAEYLPKHLRKTCETWHDTHKPGIGPVVTGHAERSVSGRHYVNREWQLVEAINGLPQPPAFLQIFDAGGPSQRQLF